MPGRQKRATIAVVIAWAAIGLVSLVPPVLWLVCGFSFVRGGISVDKTDAP